jgi:molybdenum cofactor synthesis domain-containing protein
MSALPAAVITVSDRSAQGLREDASGPLVVTALREAGFACADPVVVADGADSVETALRDALDRGARLVVTTGGTGLSPRDQTPEGTARVIDRVIPGVGEELRRRGALASPRALLTRGLAGVVDPEGAFVVNLPGSTGGVADGMPLVVALAGHVLDQLSGGDHA